VRPKEPVVVGQRPVGGPPRALCSRGLHSGIIHRQPAGSDGEYRAGDPCEHACLYKARIECKQIEQGRGESRVGSDGRRRGTGGSPSEDEKGPAKQKKKAAGTNRTLVEQSAGLPHKILVPPGGHSESY
jgi:hypothetical protein